MEIGAFGDGKGKGKDKGKDGKGKDQKGKGDQKGKDQKGKNKDSKGKGKEKGKQDACDHCGRTGHKKDQCWWLNSPKATVGAVDGGSNADYSSGSEVIDLASLARQMENLPQFGPISHNALPRHRQPLDLQRRWLASAGALREE